MAKKFNFIFINKKDKRKKLGRINKFNTLKSARSARSTFKKRGDLVSKIAKTSKI